MIKIIIKNKKEIYHITITKTQNNKINSVKPWREIYHNPSTSPKISKCAENTFK
jgi:hypothetical protein